MRGENADVEYDTKSHTLTVTVDDDGEVTQKWDGHPTSDDAQVIENIYSPKTTLALSLQKEYLEKETNEKLDISQGQFSFTLSPADSNLDAPMPTNPVAETDGDGKVKWEDITYEDIGEWDYIVTENDPKDPSVIWDETEHKVHVSVIRNLDHTLSASWTWDGAAASPTVSNQHYSPVHLPLTGSTGITATFQAGAALCAIGITGALLSKRKPEKVKPYKPKHLDKK